MKRQVIHISLFTFLALLFISFQNFSKLQKILPNAPLNEGILPSQDQLDGILDTRLKSLALASENNYLVKKCFETRVSCVGNRKYHKCLADKVQIYSKCTKISVDDVLGEGLKNQLTL